MTEATAKAMDLIKVLNLLINVLQQEIELLHSMKPSAMQALQEDKIVLIAAYESLVRRFREQPDQLNGLDQELRERIVQATGNFQSTLTENARALFAVKEANERLFKAVVEAAESQMNDAKPYSAGGVVARPSAPRNRPPMSLTLDQRL